jgi:hypothetical protein
LNEFESHYAKSAPVGPGTPVEKVQNVIRQMLSRSASTSTVVAAIDERVQFATREAPELWNQVQVSRSRSSRAGKAG